jgi:hypothetical protein
MPRGDGTGPTGQGPIGGGRSGVGSGRGCMGGSMAAGPGGYCICPKCEEKVSHVRGAPCNSIACPKCGTLMTRGK